jgi:hypothetical protein
MGKSKSDGFDFTFPSARRWSSDDARTVLAAWEVSGLTLTGFARQNGMNVQRLIWWRKRLGSDGHGCREMSSLPAAPVSFIPAVVERTRPAAMMAIVVRLPGGVEVEASGAESLPARWLAEVANAMGTLR